MLKFLIRLGANEHVILSGIAILIGLLVGYGAILFRELIDLFQTLVMGAGGENVVEIVAGLPWWQVLIMPVVGGLVASPLVHYLFPTSRGHGVPEVMAAVALDGGRLSIRDGLGKMLASSISIGSGGSVGREGPVIHLGATIGSWVGQLVHMSTQHMRTMVGCGAAAGIAASFNAPIAGVMFALEVILADYGLATFSPIVLSSVVATIVARMHLGNFPAFIVPHYTLVSTWEIPAYGILGILCGFIGIGFMVTLFFAEERMAKLPWPVFSRPVAGGLMVGAIALIFPQVLGVGYDSMNMALLEEMTFWMMAGLVVAKVLATAITLASGFSGGTFTPALFLGAMTGGAFGTLVHFLAPAYSAGPGAYTLVGMGAMAASVLGAPISCILILFELTGDYRLMVAVMVAVIAASVLIQQVYGDSIYTRALRRKKINLWAGRESTLLQQITVAEVMKDECDVIPESMTIRHLKERLRDSRDENFLVVDEAEQLKGIVSFQDLRGVVFQEGLEDLVLVRDIASRELITVTPGDNLHEALRRMGAGNVEQLPVVSADHPSQVLGIITNQEIIRVYNHALLQRESGLWERK